MKTKIFLPLSLLALLFILGTVYFTAARNPASESEHYLLPAQAQPAIAGLSTSESYSLFHSGGEALGGGQESASESYGLRSGFWLGDDTPAIAAPSPVYLPIAIRPIPCLVNTDEAEPNNGSGDATGPLCLNQNNFGQPDDNWDYFYFTLNTPGQIVVDVTNHPLAAENGAQVLLYYQAVSPGNLIGEPDVLPPYQIPHNAAAGTYYLVIFNDISKCAPPELDCSLKYMVRVSK